MNHNEHTQTHNEPHRHTSTHNEPNRHRIRHTGLRKQTHAHPQTDLSKPCCFYTIGTDACINRSSCGAVYLISTSTRSLDGNVCALLTNSLVHVGYTTGRVGMSHSLSATWSNLDAENGEQAGSVQANIDKEIDGKRAADLLITFAYRRTNKEALFLAERW